MAFHIMHLLRREALLGAVSLSACTAPAVPLVLTTEPMASSTATPRYKLVSSLGTKFCGDACEVTSNP